MLKNEKRNRVFGLITSGDTSLLFRKQRNAVAFVTTGGLLGHLAPLRPIALIMLLGPTR
jgi:hypothetical protein